MIHPSPEIQSRAAEYLATSDAPPNLHNACLRLTLGVHGPHDLVTIVLAMWARADALGYRPTFGYQLGPRPVQELILAILDPALVDLPFLQPGAEAET